MCWQLASPTTLPRGYEEGHSARVAIVTQFEVIDYWGSTRVIVPSSTGIHTSCFWLLRLTSSPASCSRQVLITSRVGALRRNQVRIAEFKVARQRGSVIFTMGTCSSRKTTFAGPRRQRI